MEEHRLCNPTSVTVINFDPPFSSFDYVDKYCGGENPAIRRLFSLARSHHASTLMIETINPAGIISDENDEIMQLANDYKMVELRRVSFWDSKFNAPSQKECKDENCIGYAILKHDNVSSKKFDEWHVFEAVFKKYPHEHNCVPNSIEYNVLLGGIKCRISGLLYSQQNGLNKTCAQVALRSLISRLYPPDISYRIINQYANVEQRKTFNPADGLETSQIRAVLERFKIGFRDFDYTQDDPVERVRHPYQKYIYSGIESGIGALLGFRFTGPAIIEDRQHVIPFYGHTFNKDTWAPEADIAYFRVGERLGYVPSEYWTSSFLGHDDSFGPNFCVPRLYILPERVEYVVELLKPGIAFNGAQAETISLDSLYSVLADVPNHISPINNLWLKRLIYYANPKIQRIVLRAIAVEKGTYIKHISHEKDWEGNYENKEVIDVLNKTLPKALWIVEVSIPQLFPANERKLGDIILNGEIKVGKSENNRSCFLFTRLPGYYFFRRGQNDDNFLVVPSNLKSHVPLIHL